MLSDQNGGGGENFDATEFVDTAGTDISAGVAPFPGSYRPDQPLADLDGTDATGSWSLHVEDNGGADVGTIDDFVLFLCLCADCEIGAVRCADGADNDGDGDTDCDDADCTLECGGVLACDLGDEYHTLTASDLPLGIVDFGTTTSTIDVGLAGYTVQQVAVGMSLTHTWDSDLDITLFSDAGTPVILSANNGGSGDNYTDTIFVDTAGVDIWAGAAPFNGSYRPEEPLSTLAGEDAGASWDLQVHDGAGADVGNLTDYDLYLCVTPP
jgi:subtilisin-like proprotein convertase family protein